VEGFLDKAPIDGARVEGQLHKVGSKSSILGLDGAEIDQTLLGTKEGEFAEITQAYPVNHPDQRLAGKSVDFRLQVKSVKQQRLPALDDEFAKDLGNFDSLEALPTGARRRVFGAGRATEEGGTLTIVAATGHDTEALRWASTRLVLEGSGPSGTLGAERLA
jgi:FKBP-type peptidyl-prolyl cis-trans isomerase (trigger factor)